jgi:hypothetical protein
MILQTYLFGAEHISTSSRFTLTSYLLPKIEAVQFSEE